MDLNNEVLVEEEEVVDVVKEGMGEGEGIMDLHLNHCRLERTCLQELVRWIV